MDKDKILEDIFENDPFGILNVKAKNSAIKGEEERLIDSFKEIGQFVEKTGREPEPNTEDIAEYKLYSRLKGIRESSEKIKVLEPQDTYSLLVKVEKKEISSIEDIFNDDSFGLLEDDSSGLFDFNHTPKETQMPDYIAKRKVCKDFNDFEHKLTQCQKDLREGKRKLMEFRKEQQIDKGHFFVLKGVLLYVAAVGERKADANRKTNARLRCIFENGTESDMLLRSLAAELYKDGRRITEHDDKLLDNFKNISTDDQESGYIYILRSLSEKAEIKSISNLFKIGYSKTDVESRVKNAEKEATYLMAAVKIVEVYQCYNMNPQKLEQLLHNVFGNSCLELTVHDLSGKKHRPREWFIVPLNVIEEAINLIISGEIVNYKYDERKEDLVFK